MDNITILKRRKRINPRKFSTRCLDNMPLVLRIQDCRGFPGGAVVKNPPANTGDMGSSPGPGRSRMLQSN